MTNETEKYIETLKYYTANAQSKNTVVCRKVSQIKNYPPWAIKTGFYDSPRIGCPTNLSGLRRHCRHRYSVTIIRNQIEKVNYY